MKNRAKACSEFTAAYVISFRYHLLSNCVSFNSVKFVKCIDIFHKYLVYDILRRSLPDVSNKWCFCHTYHPPHEQFLLISSSQQTETTKARKQHTLSKSWQLRLLNLFKETKHRMKRGLLQAVSCYHQLWSYMFKSKFKIKKHARSEVRIKITSFGVS